MNKGFITLLSTIIVAAVGALVAVSLLLLGLASSRTSFSIEQSKQARFLANTCMEEALQEIRDSTPYTGTDTLTVGQGTCTYTVVNDGGQNRTITASGTVDSTIRKISVTIDAINPDINITSWQEVADF